jgi:hypothetical protein
MQAIASKFTVLALFAGALCAGSQDAHAGGYYYQPRSLYVMPPMYAYQPVFAPQPIVVYEPVVTYPAPVAGYVVPTAAVTYRPAVAPVVAPVVTQVAPVAAPVAVGPGRVVEQQVVTPAASRYRYHVHNAYGPDYTYRVRDNGYRVRFSERWSR